MRHVSPSSYLWSLLKVLNEISMPPKRKNRPISSPPLFKESKKSPDEKRSRAEGDKIFEALDMAENLGVKVEAILKKLEKLDVIEHQLKEVHVKVANIEESISKLDSEVHVLTTRTTKLETDVKELEQGFQYNEEDVRDLQRDNKKLEHEVYDLKKQLLYMETYSRRENLKFFGVPENTERTMEEGASEQRVVVENTREVMYQFLEEKLKIEQPREKIEFQRIHRLGKPNSFKPRPIIARFLRYSDRELVMENARKHLKSNQDFHVFEDIPKDLYELRKQQMKKCKEARERGCKAYFSKANPDKLFVNGKYVAPDQPLQ